LISTTTNHLLPAAALGGGKDSKSALHLTQQRLTACCRFCHDQMQAFKYVSARRFPPLSAWHSEVFYGSHCDAQQRSQLSYNRATQVKNEASCVPQCHVSLHIRRAKGDSIWSCPIDSRMWPLALPRLFPAYAGNGIFYHLLIRITASTKCRVQCLCHRSVCFAHCIGQIAPLEPVCSARSNLALD
jgi:hypothetical protein